MTQYASSPAQISESGTISSRHHHGASLTQLLLFAIMASLYSRPVKRAYTFSRVKILDWSDSEKRVRTTFNLPYRWILAVRRPFISNPAQATTAELGMMCFKSQSWYDSEVLGFAWYVYKRIGMITQFLPNLFETRTHSLAPRQEPSIYELWIIWCLMSYLRLSRCSLSQAIAEEAPITIARDVATQGTIQYLRHHLIIINSWSHSGCALG